MFFAAATKATDNPALMSILGKIMNVIIVPIIEGLFIFTLLIFTWGVVELIMHADEDKAREKGRQHILWGVIGIAIMVSAFGLIRLIGNTIGVEPFQF